MATAQFPLCNHMKANGVWCGSPALRGHSYCHFHHQWRETKPNLKPEAQPPAVELPLLEDANAIQVALQRVMQAILDGRLDNRKAGLLLYALQTAASNLKNTFFEHPRLTQQAQQEYAYSKANGDDGEGEEPCDICAEDEDEPEAEDSEQNNEERKEEKNETEPNQIGGLTPVPSPSSASSALKGFPAPRIGPLPEHDEELDDEELIKMIRQLAGLS